MELNINLLPQPQRERFKTKKTNAYLISWAIILLILAVGILILVFFLKTAFGVQKNRLDKEIQNAQQELSKKGDVKTKVEAFNQIMNVAGNLDKSQINWSKIMTDLASATPIDIQLINYKLAATGDFTVSGKAASLRSIIKFKEKISLLPYLSQIELVKSTLESSGNKMVYSFELKGKSNLLSNQAGQ